MACAVVDCRNGAKQKKLRGSELTFHRFPKTPDVQKVWIAKCKRPEVYDPKHGIVCSEGQAGSDHFLPEDYQRDLKNELLQIAIADKETQALASVRSVFPGRIIHEKTRKKQAAAFNRKKRAEKRDSSRIVLEILKKHEKQGIDASSTDIEEAEQEDLKPLIQEINSN